MSDDVATPEFPVSKRSRWFGLRVATSVFFRLLTMALCVLWVRSYWISGMVRIHISHTEIDLGYNCGTLGIDIDHWARIGDFVTLYERPTTEIDWSERKRFPTFMGFLISLPEHFHFPCWVLVLLTTLLAVKCARTEWLRPPRQFSLRDLLIATTLVAVVLGLIALMAR